MVPIAMASQPDAEALYREADRLLKKWRNHKGDRTFLEDARQELVLAGLRGIDMRARLQTFTEKELAATSMLLPAKRSKNDGH